MSASPRLIVADPGLTGPEGHHLHYSEGVAEAALARGIRPVVVAGAGFTGSIADGRIPCEPRFSARYQTSGGGGWPRQALFSMASRLPAALAGSVAPPIRQLRRQLRRGGGTDDPFGRELATVLAELGEPGDNLILLHSVSAANLASLAEGLAPGSGHLLIVLRRTLDDMDTDDSGPRPIAEILRRLRGVHGANLTLYADTAPLAALFEQSVGSLVHVVPPPVAVPPGIEPSPDPHARPHVVFIGGARREKNYHHLPAIVAACRGRARFTIHSGAMTAAADPLLQRAHRELQAQAGPDLGLIETALTTADYWSLLASADLILLPYDAAAYGPRSSGILVESLALGVPALVPAGCWMEHAGGPSRTVVMAAIEDAPDAVSRALAQLPELQAAARAGQQEWRDAHSSEALLSALLTPLGSAWEMLTE